MRKFKLSCIIALVIISLQIRKSLLKIKTAGCRLWLIHCCYGNSHWGYSTVPVSDNCNEIFQNIVSANGL